MKTVYKKKSVVKKPKKVGDAHGLYSAKAGAKTQVIEAVYDGRVFHPRQSPMLKANTRVRITVEPMKAKRAKKKSWLMCKECAGKSKNLNANFPNEANYANMRKNSRHSPNLRNSR
jgi:predicted DNA-binding antitoxin AbrB/MazE fold protein